ncbi:HAMP domain-containing sensor histidine kinase [Paenibacillus oceani]|uniref:histidine kinase n=1 Tax=Paenibacillus oceani TaxID=2772510 RepID=A0A927CFB9_9BACL|nr:HAMP domain-containing sensor histidine kinase [Paenibacillus oceani]MBD2864745.1 HAMP domain-containing histidine kinase [Paenibacillus oceani]
MSSRWLSALSWRRSIRLKMFGAILLSFALTVVITAAIQTYLTRVTSVIGYYMSFLSETVGDLLFLAFFVCSFLFLFFMFMRSIVHNMRTLADGLMSIANGDLDFRMPESRQDELGIVARNINYMAEQLQETIAKQRKLEESKMELITNVSHDLRTPLTSVIGYLNLLHQDDYGDLSEHKRYIRNALNKSQQLKKLIDDLFEYTRFTSGGLMPQISVIDLGALIEQVVTEFEPIAGEHGLKVKLEKAIDIAMAHVDAKMLVRAVDNLLMNALKFSIKPGEIITRLTQREDRIIIAVDNWGDPITAEQEELLFDRFYKAEPSRTNSGIAAGAGLGLSINRTIMELHGGRIYLYHRNGYYSFCLEFPSVGEPH